jgi:hypothetical protein
MLPWIKVQDYQAEDRERALGWAPGWHQPQEVTFGEWDTTDGRGNDVAKHVGWMLAGVVGALYEDFGYFSEDMLKYYGIDAVKFIVPMKMIEVPDAPVST